MFIILILLYKIMYIDTVEVHGEEKSLCTDWSNLVFKKGHLKEYGMSNHGFTSRS